MEIVYTNRQKRRQEMLDNIKADYEKLRAENPTVKRNRLLCTLADKYGYKSPMSVYIIIRKLGLD